MSKELVERLRIVSNMINIGEKISWGEETRLMDQAADLIEKQQRMIDDLYALGTNHFPYDGPNGPCEKALDRARSITTPKADT